MASQRLVDRFWILMDKIRYSDKCVTVPESVVKSGIAIAQHYLPEDTMSLEEVKDYLSIEKSQITRDVQDGKYIRICRNQYDKESVVKYKKINHDKRIQK